METKKTFLTKPKYAGLPRAEKDRRWKQHELSVVEMHGPVHAARQNLARSRESDNPYLAGLLAPEECGRLSGVPDEFSVPTHRFQSIVNTDVEFGADGTFQLIAAPNLEDHFFQIGQVQTSTNAPNDPLSISLGDWESIGNALVPTYPRSRNVGDWRPLSETESSGWPPCKAANGIPIDLPVGPPVNSGWINGVCTTYGPNFSYFPFTTTVDESTVTMYIAVSASWLKQTEALSTASNLTFSLLTTTDGGNSQTVTSLGSTNYATGGNQQFIFGPIVFGDPSGDTGIIGLRVSTTAGTMGSLIPYNIQTLSWEPIITTGTLAPSSDLLVSASVPNASTTTVGLTKYRLVSMSMLVTYRGNTLANGKIAGRLQFGGRNPIADGSINYDIISQMPGSFDGPLLTGAYVFWRPTQITDLIWQNPQEGFKWDLPWIVVAGLAPTTDAQSLRVRVIANWEAQSDLQQYNYYPSTVAPTLIWDAFTALQSFPTAMENPIHLAKIGEFLSKALSAARPFARAAVQARPLIERVANSAGFGSVVEPAFSLLGLLK